VQPDVRYTRGAAIDYTRSMAGIVFLRTADFDGVREFYLNRVGMTIWLEQPNIAILRHGNLLVGFHRQPTPDLDALLTFFYDSKADVDAMYETLQNIATAEPRENPTYRIYHFYGIDPEGRRIEFQHFLHPVPELAGS
jgi:hypothetical protein